MQFSKKPVALKALRYPKKQRRILTYQEVQALPTGSTCVFDTETFPNYFLCAFKFIDIGAYFYFELSEDSKLDAYTLRFMLWRFRLVSFNGINYDVPLLETAMKTCDIAQIKAKNDELIYERTYQWKDQRAAYNHIDLIEVAPLHGSLKLYAGRLHCQRMQENPNDPHKPLTREEAENVREYCFNDCDNTELLFNELLPAIKLREELSIQYKEDMRSKSDAQIGETVISTEFERTHGYRPKKPNKALIGLGDETFTYTPPSYLQFKTPLLQGVLRHIQNITFTLDGAGYVQLPAALKNFNVDINKATYRIRLGGLHSSETCKTIRSNERFVLLDRDVSSYYPLIILNSGVAPESMGEGFLDIFRIITDRRIAAKKAKRMAEADGLKITSNGAFGKLGSPYSIMYAPPLLIYVTLTGQLSLLLNIEMLELNGFEIVSANTDGILVNCERSRETEFAHIMNMWESQTGYITEEKRYAAYFARDVNNYLALDETGEWKAKGEYTEKGSALNSPLSRNPDSFVCLDAVKGFLKHGIPVDQTIRQCKDVRRFVAIQNVKGGAHKNGIYLGKVIRWYYGHNEFGEINDIQTGNKVASTTGTIPLMELGEFPRDMDFQWYENKANAILRDIGALTGSNQLRLTW